MTQAPIAGPSQPPNIEEPEAADAKAKQAAADADTQTKAEADAKQAEAVAQAKAEADAKQAAEDAQKAADAEERQATEACTALDQKTAPKPLIPPPIDLCRCRSCTRYYPMEHFPSYCCNGADTTATYSEQTKLSSPLHLCSTVSRRKR